MEHVKICVDKIIEDRNPYLSANRSLWEERWKPSQTLNISFLNGDRQIHEKVERIAKRWVEQANLKFNFCSNSGDESDIRIGFNWNGDLDSWSYIGTDANNIKSNKPTMNFGWLGADTSDSEYLSIVLHEFGHALGLIHEFQNPPGNDTWNKKAVYAYFSDERHKWSTERTDELMSRYCRSWSNSLIFDPKSIMLYRIPTQLANSQSGRETEWNMDLSDTDKLIIRSIYPPNDQISTTG
jgi:serralysin